jgi:hypothetical protein
MSKFYGDIMRDHSDSYTTGFYGGLPVYLKFSTAPSAKIGLKQSYKVERELSVNESDQQVVSHSVHNGVTLKTSCSGSQVNSKFKFTNSEAVYEAAYKPKDANKDGRSLTLKHNSSFDTDSKVVKSTESVKFGSGLFGDAKLGVTLDYGWNNTSNDQSIKASANITHNEINFGVKTDYNIKDKKTKSLLAQAAYNTAKVNHFLTADLFSREVKYATISLPAYKANEVHACDIVVDGTRALKGFFGYPLTTSWAGIYTLNAASTLRVKMFLGAEWNLGFAWGQAVNKNLEVNFSHDLNVSKVISNKAVKGESPYNFGLALKWNL